VSVIVNESRITLKRLLFMSMIFLFVITFNSGIVNTTITGLVDEVFLLLSVLIIFASALHQLSSNKIQKIYGILLLYFIYQVVNYFYSPFELKIGLVVAQSLINIKVFLVAFATLLIWQDSRFNKKIVKKIYYLFIGLFLIGMFLNFALQEWWHIVTGHAETISYRYGFIRPVGWLGHAAQNAYFFAITFVTLFLLYAKKPVIRAGVFVKKFFIFIIIDFLMAFPLSVRKGMMMIFPFGLTAFSQLRGSKKIVFALIAVVFIILFLFIIKDTQIMQDTLQNINDMTTDDGNSYIRGLMIFYGASLFWEFFPFGVGNATFGTVLSQYNTLDVYSYVGLRLDWLTKQDGTLSGVYDSGLFSMMAENGFIGMLLMFSFIYYFFKFNRNRLDPYNYLIFKIITWFAILLSLTEPVWQNGMFTVVYVINLLFIYTKNNLYRDSRKWVAYEK